MNMIEILILGLACWRLSSLFVEEKGPFGIFLRIRKMVGIERVQDGMPFDVWPNTLLGELLSCVWCFSVWASAMLVLAYIFLPQITMYFATWLTLSTIAIVVNDGMLRR
jgi:hypothetical protein